MSLDVIRKVYQQLLEFLGFLEQEKIKASSFEEKFSLKKKIDTCQARLKFLAELLSGQQTLIGELSPQFRFEMLLDESWDNEIISQPVLNKDSESDPDLGFIKSKFFPTHLVVGVFWQQRSKKTIRVQPELCYRDPTTKRYLKESLAHDNCSLSLSNLPQLLEELTKFTASKLNWIFSESLQPWKLTIELFVPIDLLGFPLAHWCGKSSKVVQTHAIVIRCSDRFDPDRPGDSANLHNQLKAGWQRFQEHVPDELATAKLKDLNWLQPPTLGTGKEILENYSGLKCFGNWLKPGQTYLEHWEELVLSGIPLALWICKGQPQPSQISQTYDQLTDSQRFEFLDRVRLLLNEQLKKSEYYIGVFYEDPNYVPTVPATRGEQYFSWPGTA